MEADQQKLIQESQNNILERALIAFVEDVDGKVPTDEEIINNASHIPFAASPLATFTQEGVTFHQYFVWRNEHALALRFDDQQPLELKVVRVSKHEWPPALRLYVEQHPRPAPAAPKPD